MKFLCLFLKLAETTFRVDVDGVFGMLANVESLLESLRSLDQIISQSDFDFLNFDGSTMHAYADSRFLKAFQTHDGPVNVMEK